MEYTSPKSEIIILSTEGLICISGQSDIEGLGSITGAWSMSADDSWRNIDSFERF
ncbi:MAG: hypothetical protein PUC61_05610 [Bacteroidales bacterium]|nr:hypothetical protein [Bacteroidales bacterium]